MDGQQAFQLKLPWTQAGRLAASLTLLALVGCADETKVGAPDKRPGSSPPNILLIIADDMGVETLASYGIGSPTAVTPNLDNLVSRGARFENFWSAPTCTPTRALIASGRYGFRTGVKLPIFDHAHLFDTQSSPIPPPDGSPKELDFSPLGPRPLGEPTPPALYAKTGLPPGPELHERLLPAILKTGPKPYATAGFGKWHLNSDNNGDLGHPNLAGFDHYSGIPGGSPESHFSWYHITNGRISVEQGYADQRFVDDAVAWIGQQREPWFAWIGLANPHLPEHLPPLKFLHSNARKLDPNGLERQNMQPYFLARIEAMDTLIGDLLAGIPADQIGRTYVFFLGDNGSVYWSQPPAPVDPARAKGTVYQGGIHVPLIVTGPGVKSGTIRPELVSAVDIFATLIELAGLNLRDAVGDDRGVDSRSVAPLLRGDADPATRDFLFVEGDFGQRPAVAIRDEEHKLIRFRDSSRNPPELYNLKSDPYEKTNLLHTAGEETSQVFQLLQGELDRILEDQ